MATSRYDILSQYNLRPQIRTGSKPTAPTTTWTQVGTATKGFGYPTTHYGLEPVYSDYISPYEELNRLTEDFNKQPLTYQTDPVTGQVIATRTMAKPPLPTTPMGQWGGLYAGGQGNQNLNFSWILPKGAMSGPSMIQSTAPESDWQRQSAWNTGVGGFRSRADIMAQVNPQTFWPQSAFKVPMQEAAQAGQYDNPYTMPTPAFGGAVNYATGEWIMPQSTTGTWGQPYGKFNAALKAPPTIPAEVPRQLPPAPPPIQKQPTTDRAFGAMPGQTAFGQPPLQRTQFQTDWEELQKKKKLENQLKQLREAGYNY